MPDLRLVEPPAPFEPSPGGVLDPFWAALEDLRDSLDALEQSETHIGELRAVDEGGDDAASE